MKKEFKLNTKFLLAILVVSATLLSCSKWDDYKKYTEGGEIIYSGKLDSVKAYSGNKRVRITGMLNADPKIKTIKIFWNNNLDSVVYGAATSIVNGVFNQTFPVVEGIASFTIYTYDAAGNRSVPVYTSATIYGDRYQSTLQNRLISNAQMQTNGSAKIDWADVNAKAGVVGMQVKFVTTTLSNRDTVIRSTSPTGLSSVLPNYKPDAKFQYRTLYKPDSSSIDTFYTVFEDHAVKYDLDVTSLYLGNTATPFAGIPATDARFGTMAAPWITNATGKNKGGGTYGGWLAEPWQGTTGFIGWETWGNTPITDGMIYQPTSSPLPAGNYTIEFTDYSEIQTNSSVFCVVAAGGTGIPTKANLSTALASKLLFNGANVGATSPNTTETKTFSFTLSSPQVVSIGFLGNLTANNYFIVKNIKLIQNK